MNKNVIVLTLILSAPFQSQAGTWYDDWNERTINTYDEVKVYEGIASCDVNGMDLWGYVHPIYQSSVYMFRDPYNFYGTGWTFSAEQVPYGFNYCKASVPFTGETQKVKSGSYKEYYPELPFAANYNIERLGCISISQRRVVLSLDSVNGDSVSNMKVYGSTSPYFPETLFYSGPFQSNKIITVNATSDNMNFRVKLDNGSSSYTSISRMSCNSGNPRPLD